MKIKIFVALSLLPIFIGCSQKAAHPIASPSTFVKASVTPLLISTPTLLPTISLTATARQTPIPYPTTPAEATEQAVANRYCDSLDYPHPNGFLLSKSGKFVAFVCWPSDGKDISVTKVIALDGSRPPVQASYRKDYLGINYSQPIPQDIQASLPIGIDNYALFPQRWTADDKFLYLVKNSPADGVPYPPNIFALMRLDVETGKVTSVLPPIGNYYFDFSLNGTKLLFVNEAKKPLIVKVENLVTGDENDVQLDKRFDQAGFFRLSPDGGQLLISALDDEKGDSIILADLRAGSQRYLDDHYDYNFMSWVNEQTIYGSGRENGKTFFFYLDTTTMQTSPAPNPTPIPTETPRE